MLGNQAHACNVLALLAPVAAANTSAATGSWTDVSAYIGALAITQNVGVVTAGSITGKIQHADDSSGTNSADVTGAAFTAATSAGIAKIVVAASGLKPYIRYIGTVATGPAVVSCSMLGHPQYVG
jgi:hypothetical protein